MALTPVILMLLIVSAAFPEFVNAIVCAAPAFLMICVPKLRLVGLRLTTGAVAVPARATVCVPAVSLRTMLPVRAPPCVGWNEMVKVQVAPFAARVWGQLFV